MKRSEQINIRATDEDVRKIKAAAAAAWPGASFLYPLFFYFFVPAPGRTRSWLWL
jgi:hypothetical protein